LGQDFLDFFLWFGSPTTEKRNSRVRRETKRPALPVMQNTEARKANSHRLQESRLKPLPPKQIEQAARL
jgi:hypothetical protein